MAAAAAAASAHRSAGENSPGRKNLRARASALNARTSKYDCSHRGNWRRRCCAIEKGRARPSLPPPPSLKCNACEMMPAHFSVLGVRACVRMQQHRRKSPCAWHANIMTKRRLRWRWRRRRRRRTAKCVHFRHYFYFFCCVCSFDNEGAGVFSFRIFLHCNNLQFPFRLRFWRTGFACPCPELFGGANRNEPENNWHI